MALTLCVLLWPRDGREDAVGEYEDAVLEMVGDHGGRVISRVRRLGDGGDGGDGGPLEVQVIEFPDEAALGGYMCDPRRLALADARDAAVARTQVLRVRSVV